MVVPRAAARWVGILDVGGGRAGRGMWLFVEADTVIFDVVLTLALLSLVNAVRGRRLAAPLFWLMLIVIKLFLLILGYASSAVLAVYRYEPEYWV